MGLEKLEIYVTGLVWLSEQNAHVNEPFDSALQKQTRRCSLHACNEHRKYSKQMQNIHPVC